MTYHVVFPRRMGLQAAAAESEAGKAPRHSMWLLARELGATLHEPEEVSGGPLDGLRSKVAGPAALWAMARGIASRVGPDDSIFCVSEAGGVQVAALCGALPERPRISMVVHNLDRPRGRVALKLWRLARKVDLFYAVSDTQTDFLRRYLGLPASRVKFIWDHTDRAFFTPGPPSQDKPRPTIVSVGLEQRDYRTLAAATHDLPVDVRISGFSKDAAALAQTLPDPMPANMSRRFYAWHELVQLYRDADVVVVSSRENKYAAGVQSLMEAMACRRPVVATATEGLSKYLDPQVVVAVTPGNVAQMREAILQQLRAPQEAEARAQHGYAMAGERHDMDRYVAEVAADIRSLQRAT